MTLVHLLAQVALQLVIDLHLGQTLLHRDQVHVVLAVQLKISHNRASKVRLLRWTASYQWRFFHRDR